MIGMVRWIVSTHMTRQPEPAVDMPRLLRGLRPTRGHRMEVHGRKPSLSPRIRHRADTEGTSNPHVRRGAGKTPSPTRTSGHAGVRTGNAKLVHSLGLHRKSNVSKKSLGYGEA
jgi:hypothetical protein